MRPGDGRLSEQQKLRVARDGVPLDPPVRERPFDWRALLDSRTSRPAKSA